MQTRHQARDLFLSAVLILGVVLCVIGLAGCERDDTLQVNGISKNQGVRGDSLSIRGSGFQASGARQVTVYFGDKKAVVKEIIGDQEIRVEVPGGNTLGDTVDIELIFQPGGTKQLKKAFKYIEPSRLEVEHLGKQEGEPEGKQEGEK